MNYTQYQAAAGGISRFMYRVYGWMAAGLALTAGTAYALFLNPPVFKAIFSNPLAFWGIIIAQLGLVVLLSAAAVRMSVWATVASFLGYSVLSGLTLSAIFMIYSTQSIFLSFGIAAGMFATTAIYGYVTKEDLTGIGSIARMGLFGIIIALIVNFFLKSAGMDYIISLIGVGVFTLLTAYDSQKIKQTGAMLLGQGEVADKVAVVCALILYLDFVNLFLFLLRILGRNRND